MRKFIVFLSLIFIINTNLSRENRESREHHYNHPLAHESPPPSYRESQQMHGFLTENDTFMPSDYPAELVDPLAQQLLELELNPSQRTDQTLQLSFKKRKKISGILYNEDEKIFVTLSNSELLLFSKPSSFHLIPLTMPTNTLFDYKKNEGYLCAGPENLVLFKFTNDADYSSQAPLFSQNISSLKMHCIEAFFNTTPNQCFTSTKDGKVRLWDYSRSMEKIRTFIKIKGITFPPCINFNRDTNLLLAQTALRAAALFDPRVYKPICTFETEHLITALTHNDDCLCLATTNEHTSMLSSFELRTFTQYDTKEIEPTITHLAFHPIEGLLKLLVANDEGQLFCVSTLDDKMCILDGHGEAICSAKWSSEGNPLSSSMDGTAIIWDKNCTNLTRRVTSYIPTHFASQEFMASEASAASSHQRIVRNYENNELPLTRTSNDYNDDLHFLDGDDREPRPSRRLRRSSAYYRLSNDE